MSDKDDGYQLLYAQESLGADFFGMRIFINLSARRINRDDLYENDAAALKAIEALERALRIRTAQLDPKGAEQREAYRKQIADAYVTAGVTAIYMEPLSNGYCSKPCCLNKPWFRVTSSIGHVVIGWRKSVVSIDWEGTTVKKTGQELFPSEDVTRWKTGIHAHGLDAVTDYLKRLHAEGVSS